MVGVWLTHRKRVNWSAKEYRAKELTPDAPSSEYREAWSIRLLWEQKSLGSNPSFPLPPGRERFKSSGGQFKRECAYSIGVRVNTPSNSTQAPGIPRGVKDGSFAGLPIEGRWMVKSQGSQSIDCRRPCVDRNPLRHDLSSCSQAVIAMAGSGFPRS